MCMEGKRFQSSPQSKAKSCLKNAPKFKKKKCKIAQVFSYLILFGSKLCQFGIVAQLSDVAPGHLVHLANKISILMNKRLFFIYVLHPLPQATHDPHYLQVGKLMVENLNKHARVPCGFAAISDVMTGRHEDQYVNVALNILLHSQN